MAQPFVKDTGIGISKEVQKKLFQKFGRAEDVSKVNIKGSGLGLYLAREFITAHKGRIWVESEGEGKGAMFVVELPVALSNSNTKTTSLQTGVCKDVSKK